MQGASAYSLIYEKNSSNQHDSADEIKCVVGHLGSMQYAFIKLSG